MASGEALARTITTVVDQVILNFEQNKQWDPVATAALNHAIVQVVQAHTPSPEDSQARKTAQLNLKQLIEDAPVKVSVFQGGRKTTLLATCRIQAFGSCVSNSAGPDSDLDLSVDACFESAQGHFYTMADAPPGWHSALLSKLSHVIEDRGLSKGRMERILHARVPVVKFVEAESGVACDLCVNNVSGVFKSRVMRELTRVDRRFPELVRLTKAWARQHRLNDPSRNTFNSYALTLMVLYHLQSVTPPVMPHLEVVLFGERPLQHGIDPDPYYDFVMLRSKVKDLVSFGAANKSTTAELFVSFLARFMALTQAWVSGSAENVRVDTFQGRLRQKAFDQQYIMMVEDPFDNTDNAARTLGTWLRPNGGGGSSHVADCFLDGVSAAETLETLTCVKSLLRELFGNKVVSNVDFSGLNFKGAKARPVKAPKGGAEPGGAAPKRGKGKAGGRDGRPREGRSVSASGKDAPSRAANGAKPDADGRDPGQGGAEQALRQSEAGPATDAAAQDASYQEFREQLAAAGILELREALVEVAPKRGIARPCLPSKSRPATCLDSGRQRLRPGVSLYVPMTRFRAKRPAPKAATSALMSMSRTPNQFRLRL